jgi:hypothetical protein
MLIGCGEMPYREAFSRLDGYEGVSMLGLDLSLVTCLTVLRFFGTRAGLLRSAAFYERQEYSPQVGITCLELEYNV